MIDIKLHRNYINFSRITIHELIEEQRYIHSLIINEQVQYYSPTTTPTQFSPHSPLLIQQNTV